MTNETLEYISQGLDMSEDHAKSVMSEIMIGEWTPSQIAGFLVGLKIKGEAVGEITGFVHTMREKMVRINAPFGTTDTCGTGGDGHHTFNISTAAGFVTAAADIPVAKHGNRSVSSKCGSADVLEKLGVKIDLVPEKAEQCLQHVGIAFLFAPLYHASMKHAVTPRRELGVRTVFNILGPMSNPAMAKRQVVGTFNLDVADKMTKVLLRTGSEHVLVVHSADGMDEISICNETFINELKNGKIESYKIKPEDFGLSRATLADIKGGDVETNADMMKALLENKKSAIRDVVVMNAGAAIYVGGKAETLADGVKMADEIIASGAAKQKLEALIEYTNAA